jgi:hypothetical protein
VIEPVLEVLRRIDTPGSFATRRTAGSADLRIEVKGVGPIELPVSAATARKLRAIARPATYGFRDRTLLDKRVRNCGKIPKSRIRIDRRRWKKTLAPILEQIGRDLGIPRGFRLEAELDDMLVYGPGQFFVSHQDTEKTDAMIGTMVVALPSAFKGAATVIEHHDEKVTYRAASRGLTFVAFYADCHHEARPVKGGHRVVLTYNLSLVSDRSESAPRAPSERAAVLAESIRTYFEKPRRPRWSAESAREPPDRFVYLLDHQYTQKGLSWRRLKGADAARAGALRAAAERLDCGIALALADVHETWSCEEEYGGYWRGYRDDYGGFEGEGPEDHTLVELVDSEVELRHWVGLDGRSRLPISSPLETDEVFYTKPSVDLEPFSSEHEGYMGNYGNTVDRWYHRAAIVLWPRDKTFVIRAKASASWAIRELGKTLGKGSLDEGRSMARRLLPFWDSVAPREPSRGFVARTLQVAEAVDSAELASSLLKPFAFEQLGPETAGLWGRLLERYGGEWCRNRFARFTENDRALRWDSRVLSLPRFCEALCSKGSPDAIAFARWLAKEEWKKVQGRYAAARRSLPGKYARNALLRLHGPVLAVLEAAVIADDPELKREVLEFPASSELESAEIDLLVLLLRTAASKRRASRSQALGLERVRDRSTRALTVRLSETPRADDDWSMPAPSDCRCDLCPRLASFLEARGRRRFEWPLAKAGRLHVHRAIDDHDLPVTHETRRSGSPHTLVLTKTRALFERDRAQRKRWKADLEWLEKQHAPIRSW